MWPHEKRPGYSYYSTNLFGCEHEHEHVAVGDSLPGSKIEASKTSEVIVFVVEDR